MADPERMLAYDDLYPGEAPAPVPLAGAPAPEDYAPDTEWVHHLKHGDEVEPDREHDRPLRSSPAAAEEIAEMLESWAPVDLGPVVDGNHTAPVPRIFTTRDGARAMFYSGQVNGVHGDSGIGKSWLVLAAAAQVLSAGNRALIVDYEANAAEIVARLRALGCDRNQIVGQLVYVQPNHPTGDLAVAQLLEQITSDTDLAIIDSIGEAFGLDGIDENSDAEVGPWLRRVARPLADAGPAVVLVDHGTKAADNPLHPSGSKRKRAAITGASYLITTTKPSTQDQAGVLLLTCAKDRHGTYPRGSVVARADITPYPDGGVTVNLHQSSPEAASAGPDAQVQMIARALVRFLKEEDADLSGRELLERCPIKARRETKLAALDYAARQGAVTITPAARGAKMHRYAMDLATDERDSDG